MNDRIDLDPSPSKFPRRYADVGAIPHARRMGEVVGGRMSEAKLHRLRLMAIIDKCRTGPDPVPFSTLEVILGISERHAIRLNKMAKARKLRGSRV